MPIKQTTRRHHRRPPSTSTITRLPRYQFSFGRSELLDSCSFSINFLGGEAGGEAPVDTTTWCTGGEAGTYLFKSTRTVQVCNVSDLATEREIHEFFSFSGDIEHIEIHSGVGISKMAFVTFKDPKALEIALLLSGATIVDQLVSITPVENYVPKTVQESRDDNNEGRLAVAEDMDFEAKSGSPTSGREYVTKAQGVVTNILAKGSAIGQDAMNKAKAFDEKHRLRASASEKVIAFDKRVGLTEKFTVGISVVNEKVKSVDQRLQVSDKTMAAFIAAERKLNDTGSAVKTSRYATVGAAWLNGAFNKVAKAGQVAGSKTREKFNIAVSNLTAKDSPIAV